MDVELRPEQPPEVLAAVEQLLDRVEAQPDPWWRAGIEESLYGETAARPRSTLGADLA
jgi:hypothetical protein